MENTCFVCMTVYNGQQFLREAIDSVLMQQGAQIHFCIVDDASADGSAQLLSAYAEQYPNIVRVLTNPHNQGIGRSLSRALRCYQGEAYFAMIGQDDRWGPNFLCSQMDYLNEQKAVASFADVKLIDSLGTVIESGFVRFQHKRLQELGQQELLLALIQNNFLCAASAVVSMARAGSDISLWELFGICNDRLQDCECWLNLCLRGRFVYHRRTHVDYRVHCSNFSRPEKKMVAGQVGTIRDARACIELQELLELYMFFWGACMCIGTCGPDSKGKIRGMQSMPAACGEAVRNGAYIRD